MAKQSILGRITQLLKANINSLIDNAVYSLLGVILLDEQAAPEVLTDHRI